MSSKNFSLLMAGSLLLTLVSCGNHKSSSSPQKEVNAVCAEVDCMSAVNWKILLQGRSFPQQSRVDINGTTVLNECVAKQKYSIDRSVDPEELYLENFFVPKRGELKIHVSDCETGAEVIANDNVNFEVTKGAGDVTELLINL